MRIRAFEITAQYVVIFYSCKFLKFIICKDIYILFIFLKQVLQLVRSLTIAKTKTIIQTDFNANSYC